MRTLVSFALIVLVLATQCISSQTTFARGGRGGGGGGRGGGGGYRGGGGGGYRGGGAARTPSMSRAAPRSTARPQTAARPATRPSTAARPSTGARPQVAARPSAGARPAARPSQGFAGGRTATTRPSTSDLSNFLGMPAPSGGAAARGFGPTAGARTSPPSASQLPSRGSGSRHSNSWQGDHFTIGAAGGSGSVTTPGGITIGGAGGAVAIKGPGGNTVVRGGGAIGATNGINSVGRAGGFVGGVDRYGNTAIAGRGATFANGQFVGGHSWSAVNGNFNHWNCFHSGWYGRYPGAWFPGKWAARSVWATATWAALSGWWGYGGDPMYYDYGGDVGYSDGEIYYGDQPVATEEQYYNEASDIAAQGDQAAAADEEWLPLGVFGVVAAGQSNADKLFQLAVNKAGLIRGNYYDLLSDQVQPIEGAVDAKTQRAAWHAKAKPEVVVETGIYNLTNDEVPVLVHFGPNDTQQRTLIRLQNPEDQAKPPAAEPAAAAPAPDNNP